MNARLATINVKSRCSITRPYLLCAPLSHHNLEVLLEHSLDERPPPIPRNRVLRSAPSSEDALYRSYLTSLAYLFDALDLGHRHACNSIPFQVDDSQTDSTSYRRLRPEELTIS